MELNLEPFCYLENVFDSGVMFVLLTCSPNLTGKPVIRGSLIFIMKTVVTFIVKVENEMNGKKGFNVNKTCFILSPEIHTRAPLQSKFSSIYVILVLICLCLLVCVFWLSHITDFYLCCFT